MPRSDALQQRIGERAGSLSPQLLQAAGFVRAHPAEVATHSLRQVARAAGVTPATLSRLARALGYARYESLRELCREQLTGPRESLAERAGRLQRGARVAGARRPLDGAVDGVIEHLQELSHSVDPKLLRHAARDLVRSRRVVVLGSMSCGALAEYFGHMGRMAFDNWSVLGMHEALSAHALAGLGRADTVLLVTLAPYARRTLECARVARAAGARVIALTDRIDAPVLGVATSSFLVGTEGPHFFPSHVAAIVLLETMMGMLVELGGEQARKRIGVVEQTNRALGEYPGQP